MCNSQKSMAEEGRSHRVVVHLYGMQYKASETWRGVQPQLCSERGGIASAAAAVRNYCWIATDACHQTAGNFGRHMVGLPAAPDPSPPRQSREKECQHTDIKILLRSGGSLHGHLQKPTRAAGPSGNRLSALRKGCQLVKLLRLLTARAGLRVGACDLPSVAGSGRCAMCGSPKHP